MILKLRNFSVGFTLIELLVAVSIFVTAITIISSQFILFLNSQRRALEVASVVEDGRNVLERMARTMRVSVIASANTDTNGVTEICFFHPRRGYLEYAFDNVNNNIIERVLADPVDADDPLASPRCGSVPIVASTITTTGVYVEDLNFHIDGVGKDDDPISGASGFFQPRTTISMRLRPVNQPNRTPEVLQTTVSQRCLEQHTLCVTK